MKEIKITCKAAAMISIDKLEAFQGKLKTLSEKEYKKIRMAIEKHGFSFPVFVWKSHKSHFIIDGHQRLNTVRQMIKDGWSLKDNLVPVDWIEAKTKKEAKEKILLAMSQYGKYTEESLYEFIEIEGLDFGEEKSKIALPQIDLEKFEEGWGKDLPETEEVIRPFQKVHVLLSFHPDKATEIQPFLKEILKIQGIEYEQCSN
jgi:hypothetical protein